MRYTVTLFAALALGGLIWTPTQVNAQNSKEYKELQREFYETHGKLDEIKKAQDERIGQLEAILKQLMDANTKLTEQVQLLQVKVSDSATQQERRIAAPLDEIKNGVKELWEGQQATKGSVDGLRTRQDGIEKSLGDMSGLIGLLREELSKNAAPPSASAPANATASAIGDPAILAFATAESDRIAGKAQQALDEFNAIVQAYPTSPQAPMAMYEMGVIYAGNDQPDQAIKAFDRVLEQFGDNPMRKPAQFAKAEQLAALGKNPEAAREFNNYAKQYPDDDNAEVAKQRATQLTGSGAAKQKAAPAKPKRR